MTRTRFEILIIMFHFIFNEDPESSTSRQHKIQLLIDMFIQCSQAAVTSVQPYRIYESPICLEVIVREFISQKTHEHEDVLWSVNSILPVTETTVTELIAAEDYASANY